MDFDQDELLCLLKSDLVNEGIVEALDQGLEGYTEEQQKTVCAFLKDMILYARNAGSSY